MAKLMIDGKIADKQYPLRTTDYIYDLLLSESGNRQISVNIVINEVLLLWAKKKNKIQPKK